MLKDLKQAYKTMVTDHFPKRLEISFVDESGRQSLFLEKVTWTIAGEIRGLRYGENPSQEAALYKLVNGNLLLGEVACIKPGRFLASDVELLQSGKHPGKINITDADSALNIMRYLQATPCTVIVKHNNPSGVAKARSLADSFSKAFSADRIAAFGGVVALNRACDKETADRINEHYFEVVVAPDYEHGVLEKFSEKKNLRVLKIGNMEKLQDFASERFIDFKSLIDGGIIVQWSFKPTALSKDRLVPAETVYKGEVYKIKRIPTEKEYDDLIFGWIVEAGVTSNSVLYVKDGVTVGIGTGEQDRVGVAEIARDKAYRKLAERLAFEKFNKRYVDLAEKEEKEVIDQQVKEEHGGLKGSSMVSDAFFPFRDGVDVGINEGITAIIQPGGAIRDFESIIACNEAGVAMVFTGERSFRH
jgi:phosphoribosylaminoimidazolecarboxamide formyltransferase/IMP cyclohydrolase